jgi:hypothetical protein
MLAQLGNSVLQQLFSSILYARINKAKYQELKKQLFRKEVDDLRAYVAKIYVEEHPEQVC